MFLSIPDSVMNSHILWRDVLFWRQASARVLPRWNSCFKRFKTLCWIVRFTIKLWLNCFFCLSSVCGRCFWASQILWWILTCSEQKFCFDCNALQESFLDVIDVLDDLKCSVELSDFFIKLSLKFFFRLSTVCGRCFRASQILWWILTSSEQKFCFDYKPLLEFYLNGIDVWDNFKRSVELSHLS